MLGCWSLLPSRTNFSIGKGSDVFSAEYSMLDEVACTRDDYIITEKKSIVFNEKVESTLKQSLAQAVIVKLLGRMIGYKALENRLKDLWKPVGEFQIMELENDYFLIKFRVKEDYIKALSEGSWVIYGHYLTVQPWEDSFLTAVPYPNNVTVWVNFPGLPIKYYHKSTLRAITSVIGYAVKIDYNTGFNGLQYWF
ncbi:hypothetical protein P3X46_031913 [Hevea brasiliensis]|uniref:DUF4283 domain-containing protein n=1 Tax=Hevea brasiliensis TaxID=3981 RepID=A0ABQ9KLV9_HEVBR|nr:hypothetical protein P3X46_031913 [Hevea brasiliensis]